LYEATHTYESTKNYEIHVSMFIFKKIRYCTHTPTKGLIYYGPPYKTVFLGGSGFDAGSGFDFCSTQHKVRLYTQNHPGTYRNNPTHLIFVGYISPNTFL
jgi:hypothetical protein